MSKSNEFPLEIADLEPTLNDELLNYFTGERTGFVQVGPKRYFMPQKYREEAAHIYNMPLRSSDVFVTTYPRSGTTWTQELVWMVANDLNYEKALEIPLTERYTFVEFSVFFHPILKQQFYEENKDSTRKLAMLEAVSRPGTEVLASTPSPRFVKTHLPFSLLPPALLDTCKAVYVARDPRDVAVSFYHLNKSIRTQGYIGDFKTYWKYFHKNLHHWSPYFENLKEAWEKRNHPNLLFLFYEELVKILDSGAGHRVAWLQTQGGTPHLATPRGVNVKATGEDLPKAIKRVADFFGKQFTQEQIYKLQRHLVIDNFKNNASVNYDGMAELGIMISSEQGFIRKGKAGGWRDYFDEEMTAQAQTWMDDNLRNTDIKYPHL